MPLPKKLPSLKKQDLPEIPEEKKDIIEHEDEGVFSSLDVDEIDGADYAEDEEDEAFSEYIEIEEEELTNQYHQVNSKGKIEDDGIEDPFKEGSDIEYDEDQYINKKKLKLTPFGGKKSKPKGRKNFARAKDFDDRKNSLTLVKITRLFMMIVIVCLFLFGLKNTFFPAHVFTEEDIQNISLQAMGNTGFPMNRGRAFAEQFTGAYFNVNTEDSNTAKTLAYFYNGVADSSTAGITQSGENKQKVLSPPRVFSENAVSENIAYYYVNTLVSSVQGEEYNDMGEFVAEWLGLVVTVYFNPETNELSIAKDSPQIIPSYQIGSQTDLPDADVIGTGQENSELYEAMKPTIHGFLKAYGLSSPESHVEIDQYIKKQDDPSLYSGFNGLYAPDENDLDSQNILVYPATEGDDNNEWKAVITLNWVNTRNKESRETNSYRGKYVMTLEKGSDGKYFVTAFRPYVYTPKPAEEK